MFTIYLLKLEQNKYYIGKTKQIDNRLLDHTQNKGSHWTRKYKPIETLEIIENCDKYDEDKHTIRYMDLYGINNVRGGSFVQMKLPHKTKELLKKQLNMLNDRCYKCNKSGHFGNKCLSNPIKCLICDAYEHKTDECEIILQKIHKIRPCVGCKNFSHEVTECRTQSLNMCYRCGRYDHWKITCTEIHDINGYLLRSHLLGQFGNLFKKIWSYVIY
jgi:hypothetical protein